MKYLCIIFLSLLVLVVLYVFPQPSTKQTIKKATLIIWHDGTDDHAFKNIPYLNYLRSKLAEKGYELHTYPYYSIDESDLIIAIWKYFPKIPKKKKENSYLWLIETPLSTLPPNSEEYASQFKKIFTYQKAYVNNQNIFELKVPYNFSQKKTNIIDILPQKDILITQIATNLYKSNKKFIYQQRRNDSIWLLENAPDDFLMYGFGWEKIKKELSETAAKKFNDVYKGYIPRKADAITHAKFVLTYENTRSPGYISEKIYDVMLWGAVPVYLGAPDITDQVPPDCFIDRSQFKTMEELYTFLKTMPDDVYMKYLTCIQTHLNQWDQNPKNGYRLIDQLLEYIFPEEDKVPPTDKNNSKSNIDTLLKSKIYSKWF